MSSRKDNAFERPMLENSLESISALFSSGDFPRVAATDRDDVISIYNRRIATRTTRGGGSGGGGARKDSVASSSSSQYAMLRAWVQDDPDRVMLTFGTGITSSNVRLCCCCMSLVVIPHHSDWTTYIHTYIYDNY